MAWKANTKKIELNNSAQIATWRQVLHMESKGTKSKVRKDIETLRDKIESKNGYVDIFANDHKKTTIKELEKKETYKFDQVKYDEVDRGYCQKAKHESLWCKEVKPREAPKDVLQVPMTTS
mmetsp:Transcript_4422/g.7525  ORF Transcript_4422/g.7525 Transcript_4422/m.7525 type:complete len:121 (+) Transcript_4422:39-401(+)|eukprot:CAMPEP_0168623710 /NCGR_PEP_ID=MMETSP0449_2-20121227/8978_1 /TAXON_ID=1082188 /ORGANISM="Strombidium rassoulzadegani, Strain ras09" /LENGTH=120 /DNA_ID=CAMNT_0008665125 /DNA_START=16 /DNA_END=378 /DNA_ORIENTATION=+